MINQISRASFNKQELIISYNPKLELWGIHVLGDCYKNIPTKQIFSQILDWKYHATLTTKDIEAIKQHFEEEVILHKQMAITLENILLGMNI